MPSVEVRRHTMRPRPGTHLSQPGVTLARRVGETIGPFDRVVTSTLPRAFETAIAMGFAVDEQIAFLGEMGDAVDAEVDWFAGFPAFAAAAAKGRATARFAAALAKRWGRLAATLPEGGRLLIISHGGIIEAGAVGCLPDADHRTWGRALDYCEGVRLRFDGERFTGIEILRLTETPIDDRVAIL
jgi:broad specificity phosphatase PhoE